MSAAPADPVAAAESPGRLPAARPPSQRPARRASESPPARPQARLAKLGLRTEWILALHLPLRYEDETRLTRVQRLPARRARQVEARSCDTEVAFRPRRQLVVQLTRRRGELLCCAS